MTTQTRRRIATRILGNTSVFPYGPARRPARSAPPPAGPGLPRSLLELPAEPGQQLARAQRTAGPRAQRRRVEPGGLAHPRQQLRQRLDRREARRPAELLARP